ncbi:MAG TPA: YkvA family protein [Ignavibacteriales bacterium]|nr:YkvA family protein [Ignavibacteriales bacterium]HOL80755.1 YkvA family protein [Ignavibacteriales bacterium]HOM66002.1 YkvA family protein [Ignavibacteriales bacterium]HPD67764.1 YkvA family protein [Ignavibacteriales bacterium]HPP33191.1 YkvA family protein [Ignavibacteriales bacterium]
MKNHIDNMDLLEFGDSDIENDLFNKNRPKNDQEAKVKEKFIDDNLESKLKKIAAKIKIVRHILALYRYMKSSQIPFLHKSIVIAGLMYFILPLDAIPDFMPIIGFLDDIGIITALAKYLQMELEPFY